MDIKKKLKNFLVQYGEIVYIRFVGIECQFKLNLSISNMTTDEFTIFLMKLSDDILVDYPYHKKFESDKNSIDVILSK